MSVPVRQGFFDSPSDVPILLDDLLCSGDEENLLSCPRMFRNGSGLVERELGDSDCEHSEDAGVRCDGEYGEGGSGLCE